MSIFLFQIRYAGISEGYSLINLVGDMHLLGLVRVLSLIVERGISNVNSVEQETFVEDIFFIAL